MARNNLIELSASLADGKATFGVIDIGSNSVRLVVYDVADRHPVPLFNDRVFCSLGRGVGETGLLSKEARDSALHTITRYAGIAGQLGVNRLELVATAAIRDARNGARFAREIQKHTGCPVKVISGEEEARLAALGVAYGAPGADGLVGDLGNGSLELVELADGEVRNMASLPIGALRIMSQFKGNLAAARKEVERRLSELDWLKNTEGKSFYPVGGSWRALCRIHMEQMSAPLHIIHAYTLKAPAAREFADFITRLGPQTLSGIPSVPSRRLEMMPISAAIFGGVLSAARPATVVFSAAGIREGIVVDGVDPAELAEDPLLAAASSLAARDGRSGDIGPAFSDWMDPLYPRPRKERARLRLIAATLSDIGWREHPDYRARQTMMRILRYPFLAIDHPSRAAVAWAVYIRYGGKPDNPDAELGGDRPRAPAGPSPVRRVARSSRADPSDRER